MTAVTLSKIFNDAQFFDNAGKPLNGGQIWSYLAGSDSDEAATYSDFTGDNQNGNPIILDSSGRLPNAIWLDDSLQYHLVLTDNQNSIIQQVDNVTGTNLQFIVMPPNPNYLWGTDDGTNSAAYLTSTLTVGNATNAVFATNAVYTQFVRDGGDPSGDPLSFNVSAGAESPTSIWGSTDNQNSFLYPTEQINVSEFNNDVPYAPIDSPAFTGIPTAPTAPVGTETDQIATTTFVQEALTGAGGSQLLAPSGFRAEAGGLIIQWGVTPSITQDTETHITFPLVFPTAVFVAMATPNFDGGNPGNTDNMGMVRGLTTTGMYVCRAAALRSNGIAGVMYWFAIGH